MKTYQLKCLVGPDKTLRIELPLDDTTATEVEVVLVVQSAETAQRSQQRTGWSQHFLSHVLGGWKGELERPTQGEHELRESFD